MDALALFERAEALGGQMVTGVPHNSFFFASSGAEVERKAEVHKLFLMYQRCLR
jgi:hypothetical protein